MDTWDLMDHWNLVLPPSRPSAKQLLWIQSAISSVDRRMPVAILGSTPEFRDLVCECGFDNVFVLDRNVRFYEATGKARIYQNRETLVEGDWLDTLPTLEGTFAIILSDLTSGNIPYNQRRPFYDSLAGALRPGGLFLDKVLTHSSELLPISQLLHKYSSLPLNLLYVNYFSSETLFCSELLAPECLVDSTRFYDALDRLASNARVKRFVEHSKLITPPGAVWWYGRPWSELSGDYGIGLGAVSVHDEEPDSPYAGRLKYFQMAKRG